MKLYDCTSCKRSMPYFKFASNNCGDVPSYTLCRLCRTKQRSCGPGGAVIGTLEAGQKRKNNSLTKGQVLATVDKRGRNE